LSEKIIKAGFTRLLPAEMRLHKSNEPETDAVDDTVNDVVQTPAYTAEEIQELYEATVASAKSEAEQILSRARMDAVEFALKASTEAEELREKARAEGLESGYAKGYEAFLADGEQALAELMESGQGEVDKAIVDVYAERDRLLDEMEPRILRLALDIGEKILGYELDEKKESFVSLVTTALGLMKSEGRVKVRVSAEQFKSSFRSKAEHLLKTGHSVVEAEVSVDPSVEPNGCLIDTGSGIVDASADAQMEQISRNLGLSE